MSFLYIRACSLPGNGYNRLPISKHISDTICRDKLTENGWIPKKISLIFWGKKYLLFLNERDSILIYLIPKKQAYALFLP